jgi:hypothetical protein
MIPNQLIIEGFRYIFVGPDKRPLQLDWTKTNNYDASDYRLIDFISKNRRY